MTAPKPPLARIVQELREIAVYVQSKGMGNIPQKLCKIADELAALTQAQLQHYPACNYWTNPIGSPGCICEVINRTDLAELRAQKSALMEAIEPLALASKFMVDTITDDESLGGWGITAGHSRKALRVYEQVKEKI